MSGNSPARSGHYDEAFVSLVKSASKGNREALIDLCKTIAKGILFRATRIIGNQTDAEDVTQEVMLSVCAHIHELREPKAFYVWLNRIIMNETNRYLMKKTRHGVLLNIEDYQENIGEEDEGVIPQEYAIRESDRRIVMDIVDSLPGQQRKAVLLHFYDGLTLSESAKVMNVSQPRVSRCLKFAQEKIKKELNKQAKRSNEAAFRLSVLPIGPLLAQVLNQEAADFTGANMGWFQDMISNTAVLAEGATAVAAAAATAATASVASGSAAGGGGAASASPAVIALSVAAAAVVSVGVFVISPALKAPPEPPPAVSAEYSIAFSGGSDEHEYVNPTQAAAHLYIPDRGDVAPVKWWITEAGDDFVLHEGEGGVVDEEFEQMIENEEKGDYVIKFNMRDSAGDYWVLSREFTIR